jgi:transcriptional regulator GlxA family with amidase domain
MTIAIAIYLFDDVEALDFAGPYEVFTAAGRVLRRRDPAAGEPFAVFSVARHAGLARARAGLEIRPDHTIADHPPIDVLVVPGGVVTRELERPEVVRWIANQHAKAQLTASVCTGAFLLAKAGILDGIAATTHWEDIADLRAMFPNVTVVEGRRWVDQGRVVTSGGISAGIDMSLHLVERLAGRDLALATARQMEFDWRETG